MRMSYSLIFDFWHTIIAQWQTSAPVGDHKLLHEISLRSLKQINSARYGSLWGSKRTNVSCVRACDIVSFDSKIWRKNVAIFVFYFVLCVICVIYEKCVYPKIQLHIYHFIKDGSFCLICSSLQVVATDVVSAPCVSCVFLCHQCFQ